MARTIPSGTALTISAITDAGIDTRSIGLIGGT
jgi:hypothetical protein